MINVDSLSRRYGRITAVNQVSFSIDRHEIVGLLGHNGAGKTTVMKMLSGYLEPSEGSIRIGSLDMREARREIQQRLGYLPENLPVYPEMTIGEYLEYCTVLKGLQRDDARRAIRYSVEATDLGARFGDPIGQLSRGFKQRVGVAQAILGRPDLLILDEPGNGLDPEQNEHMRALIRDLAQDATVILSTHVMQEVDALCDRVLVLANGELALNSPLSALRESRRLVLHCGNGNAGMTELLLQLPQIVSVDRSDAGDGKATYLLTLHPGTDADTAAGNVSRAVVDSGGRLFQLRPEQRSLEKIFRDAVSTGGTADVA